MNLEEIAAADEAQTVQCPPPPRGCRAPAGEPCRSLATGRPLERQPAHLARLRAAGLEHEPTTPAELAARGERTPR